MAFIVLLVLVLIGFSAVKGYLQQLENQKPENQISLYESRADFFHNSLKEDAKSPVAPTSKSILRMLSMTEDWYLQLKERDKHDIQKSFAHAKDWYDLVYQTWEANKFTAQEQLGGHDDAPIAERMDAERKLWIPILEIRKRFAKELGLDIEKINKEEDALMEKELKMILSSIGKHT